MQRTLRKERFYLRRYKVEKLNNYRKEISKINLQVLELLRKRMETSKKIGEYKKQNSLPVLDIRREQETYRKLKKSANEKGLDEKFVRKLFKLIIKQSRKEQR